MINNNAYHSIRVHQDAILPLSEPITSIDGRLLTEIVVPKDSAIIVGIRACNRNKALWGEDANEWRPERWLSDLPATVTEAGVPGIYSNLSVSAVLSSTYHLESNQDDIPWRFEIMPVCFTLFDANPSYSVFCTPSGFKFSQLEMSESLCSMDSQLTLLTLRQKPFWRCCCVPSASIRPTRTFIGDWLESAILLLGRTPRKARCLSCWSP